MKGTATSYLPAGTNTSNNNNTHDCCPSHGDVDGDVDDDDISTLNTSTTSTSTRTTKNLLGTLDGRRLATLDGRRLATLDGRRVKGLCSALTNANNNATTITGSDPRLIKAKEFMERGAGKLRRRGSTTEIESNIPNTGANSSNVIEDFEAAKIKKMSTNSNDVTKLNITANSTTAANIDNDGTSMQDMKSSFNSKQEQQNRRPSTSPRYIKESKLIKSLKKTDPDKYRRYFESIQDGSRHKMFRKSPLKTKRTTMPSTSKMESTASATTFLRRVESVPISLSLSQDDEKDDNVDNEKNRTTNNVESKRQPFFLNDDTKRRKSLTNIDISGTSSNKQDTKLIHEATVEAEVTLLNRSMSSSALMDYFGIDEDDDEEDDEDDDEPNKVFLQLDEPSSHTVTNDNNHNDDDEHLLDQTGRPSSLVLFDNAEKDIKTNKKNTDHDSNSLYTIASKKAPTTMGGLSHLSNTWHKVYSVIYRPSSDPASVALRQRGLLVLTKFQIWFISTNQNLFELVIDWNTITKCEPWSSIIDGWLSGGGIAGNDGVKNDNSAADGGVGGGEGSFIKISTKKTTTRQPPPIRASTLSSLDRSKRPAATTAKEFLKQKVVSTLSSSSSPRRDVNHEKYYFRFYKDSHMSEAMDIINTTIRMFKTTTSTSSREEGPAVLLSSSSPAPAAAAAAAATKTTTTTIESMTMKKQEALPPVPPDPVLCKMTIVASRTFDNITLKEFQNLFIFANDDKDCGQTATATTKTTTTPNEFLYKFYQTHNKFDIVIPSEWSCSETQGEWCGEQYTHHRIVSFKEHKQIPIQGMSLVQTTSNQQLNIDDKNDKIIWTQTLQMTGIPYSDTFCIIIRLVATRHGSFGEQVQVNIGVFVDFKKTNLMAGKIKSNVLENMKVSQTAFLDSIQEEIQKCSVKTKNDGLLSPTSSVPQEETASMEETQLMVVDKPVVPTTTITPCGQEEPNTIQKRIFDNYYYIILLLVMMIAILITTGGCYLLFGTSSSSKESLSTATFSVVDSNDPTNLLQHQLGMLNQNLTQLLLQTKQFVELKQELREEMQHAQDTLREIQQLLE